MISLETLESQLDEPRKKLAEVERYMSMRGIRSLKKGVEIFRLFFPTLGSECKSVLENCGAHTQEFGHSPEADRIKNKAFEILGRTVGEEL